MMLEGSYLLKQLGLERRREISRFEVLVHSSRGALRRGAFEGLQMYRDVISPRQDINSTCGKYPTEIGLCVLSLDDIFDC